LKAEAGGSQVQSQPDLQSGTLTQTTTTINQPINQTNNKTKTAATKKNKKRTWSVKDSLG
jgi:hypothetical protein